MQKVVVAPRFGLGPELLARLRETAEVVVVDDGSPAALLRELADAAALLVAIEPRITAALLDAAPRLRHVARQGVGVDIVDVRAATSRGIVVTNVPDVTSDSVAEFCLTLLLGLAKNLVRCDRAVKGGRWADRLALIQDNCELAGKTHGIVGLGRIGSRVAARCRAFGMQVLYHKRHRDLACEAATGAAYCSLETLLSASDSISLHLPLTDQTRNLIDTPQFALMKPTVLIVNHSRGTIVNEEALVRALREGQIGGYGTDVYAQEPPDATAELFSFPNVVASPHLGGGNRDTRSRGNRVVVEEVIRVLAGQRPLYPVNPEVLEKRAP